MLYRVTNNSIKSDTFFPETLYITLCENFMIIYFCSQMFIITFNNGYNYLNFHRMCLINIY